MNPFYTKAKASCIVLGLLLMSGCRREQPSPASQPAPKAIAAPAPVATQAATPRNIHSIAPGALPIVSADENLDVSDPAAEAIDQEAPRDWAEFEKWVIQEIQTIREPVPLPENPALAKPEATCIRLEQQLREAVIHCNWHNLEGEAKPLLVLGPFRSDQSSATFEARKTSNRLYGSGMQMRVSGFEIDTKEVGRITFRLRAPAGKNIDFRWSEAGFTRLPIPDNKEFWTLSLDTYELTQWEGKLADIMLRTDDVSDDGVLEIEKIQFWGHQNVFPRPVDTRPFTIGVQRRYAVYAHNPAEIRFVNLNVPPQGKFNVGLAAVMPEDVSRSEEPTAAEVRFRIVVECEGVARTVEEQTLSTGAPWADVSVSLADWAGKKVTLSLQNESLDSRVVALWGNPAVYQPVADAPIMVLYLIDAFAARHISLYGYQRPTTPTLEKLGANGVWFSNMYTNAPVTISSVPNTQLSMSTERHGVYHPSIAAPLELVTISDALGAAGYATASFITNANAGARQNMDQGFDEYTAQSLFYWSEQTSADRSVPIDEVLDWFERHRDRPAFVYIHTCEPHAPYVPPPDYVGRFDPDYKGVINGAMSAKTGYLAAKRPRDIEHVRALYDEECLFADEQLGRCLARMEAAGFGPRINVFVIADHGEELHEHGHWGHGEGLYDEALRVPLVTSGPFITARGRVDIPAQLYDIMPTILDLFGAPQPYPLAGVSLKPLLQTPRGNLPAELSPARTIIVSHHRYRGKNQIEYAVVEASRWKLHYRYMWVDEPAYPTPARFELYDLQADPLETFNRIEMQPDVARRLMCKLVAYARAQHPYESHREGVLNFDPQQLNDLEAQGYIEKAEEQKTKKPTKP